MERTDAVRPSDSDYAVPRSGNGLPFGFLAYLGTAVSVLFCYAQILVDLIAPVFASAPFQVNIHVQSVLMWVSALVAVLGLYRDRRAHHSKAPFLLGLIAFVVIAATLYTYYDVLILILGYLLLVVASLLNPAMLLISLNRSVSRQASELAALNGSLEDRVETQVQEIERLARLKRFLPSEVTDLILAEGKESLLDSHRRVIACLFCDVRNFTSFSESVEPEEVMDVLQSVHKQMGQMVASKGGTIGYRSGDGLMVIFNDPLPCDQPVRVATELALDMKAAFEEVRGHWAKLGQELGFGIGIAYGYATLGLIGSEGRYDYTAIGNVVNVAARLCDRAENGEILIDQRARVEIEAAAELEPAGAQELKGIEKPVETFRVVGLLNTTR
ncbi:MAG: adenylate/guanylate cyclase domain-containing protein [Pseudomonadota bacterium]